ncbi:DUF3560 domain-containing protein [Microtetraspora fusca]|uniref:DUF3560 domain-containing protein n=1 Tax=Microtetraspora fusca TaxID=1997 RepID=A0ABW6VEA8_MICFU
MTSTNSQTIRIVHTREEGTLVEGSRKGDGVWEIVRTRGFRFSRHVGLYIRNSRDKAADRWTIDRAAQALRDAGFTVEVDIDNVTLGRSFAEAEADRNERAEERADRYGERADRNTAAGNARWDRTRERLSHIPLGQPILVGHHSERRHRRLIDWAHTQDGKAIEETKKGKYWAGRAQAAENYQRHREDPGTTRRRIEKLEADRRRIVRVLEDGWERTVHAGEELPEGARVLHTYGDGDRWCKVPSSPGYKASREADLAQIDDELGYWREVLAQAEQRGVKLWSKADFEKGDFVIYFGEAVEVVRANAKSVSIPWAHYWINAGPIVTVEMCKALAHEKMHTDTVPYDKVEGRISRAEALAEGLTVGQARELIARRKREARGE